jgi:putative oxidoreductase
VLGAAVLVHLTHGLFVTDNGWELVGALGAGALVLAATGAGCYSVDRLLHGRAAVATERERRPPPRAEPRVAVHGARPSRARVP